MSCTVCELYLSKAVVAPTGAAQLAGHPHTKQKVADLIPSQGTCLGDWFGPGQGIYERQPIGVSVSC